MMHRIALVLATLLLCGWPSVNMGGGTPVAGLLGHDYSADAGCIQFYSFDAASETATVADACDTVASDLTIQGTVDADSTDTPSNMPGQSADFDGTAGNDFLDHPGSGSVDEWESDPISFGCFRFIDAETSSYNIMFGWRDGSSNGVNAWHSNANNDPKWQIGDSGSEEGATNASPVGSWNHFVYTWDSTDSAGALRIYVDATESEATGVFQTTATEIESTDDFALGSDGTGGLEGHLDDCFVYDGLLSAAQVCEICSFGFSGNATASRNSSCGDCSLP